MADKITWVDEFIAQVENSVNGVLKLKIGGVPITAELGKDLIAFFKANKSFLTSLGKEAFSDFLYLLHEGKQEKAFNLLASRMSADDIINAINNQANELGRVNDEHDKFVAALLAFGKNVVLPTLAKALIGLLI